MGSFCAGANLALDVGSPRWPIAPSTSLVTKKNHLFLEVKIDYVNRQPLSVDGHFVQAGTGG